MDEKVRCEVAPGRWGRIPRSEVIVRELAARAMYDPRSRKHLLDVQHSAHLQLMQLRMELERETRENELRR